MTVVRWLGLTCPVFSEHLIVDVDSPERAYDIAAAASAAPGPGGAPLDMPIEVREVMSGLPMD